jgi:hypothetical protein
MLLDLKNVDIKTKENLFNYLKRDYTHFGYWLVQ